MLEAAPADDVELGVVAHGPFDEVGQRGSLQLGEMLAGQVGDQIRGGEDGSPIDQLHGATIDGPRDSLPVSARYPPRVSSHERNPELPDPLRPSREIMRETLVERQIREAMDSGAFDDLPHQGVRLPLEDDSPAGDWALAHRMLRNAGAAPPWIESDKAARAMLDERDRLLARAPRMTPGGLVRARDEMARIVEGANRAIARVNAEAPTMRQHRRPLDLAAELDRLERAGRGEPPGAG